MRRVLKHIYFNIASKCIYKTEEIIRKSYKHYKWKNIAKNNNRKQMQKNANIYMLTYVLDGC